MQRVPTANGTVTGQKTNIRGSLFNFWCSLYADDGAFIFCNSDDMINGMSLLHTHFKRFGPLMHVGTRATAGGQDSKSKTEAMHFPWQLGKPALTKANKAALRSCIAVNAADRFVCLSQCGLSQLPWEVDGFCLRLTILRRA